MDNLAAYSIPALVEAAANGFGDKICAIAPERSVTFRQFAVDVEAIADHLGALGIKPGERVAILDVNSLNFLECLCALGVLGAVAVPLNYRQRVPEYRFQIGDSGARLLLAPPVTRRRPMNWRRRWRSAGGPSMMQPSSASGPSKGRPCPPGRPGSGHGARHLLHQWHHRQTQRRCDRPLHGQSSRSQDHV